MGQLGVPAWGHINELTFGQDKKGKGEEGTQLTQTQGVIPQVSSRVLRDAILNSPTSKSSAVGDQGVSYTEEVQQVLREGKSPGTGRPDKVVQQFYLEDLTDAEQAALEKLNKK